MLGGWHGRTVATLACTDGAKYEAGAQRAGMPLSRRVPFNDIAALEAAVDETVAAVLLEPVQGFSGARSARRRNFSRRPATSAIAPAPSCSSTRCSAASGRSGRFTAAEIFRRRARRDRHGQGARGRAPDRSRDRHAVAGRRHQGRRPRLDLRRRPGAVRRGTGQHRRDRARATAGERPRSQRQIRQQAAAALPHLVRCTVAGFLLGLEFDRPAADVQRALWKHRILTGTSTDPKTLRLLPPLSFARDEAELLLARPA